MTPVKPNPLRARRVSVYVVSVTIIGSVVSMAIVQARLFHAHEGAADPEPHARPIGVRTVVPRADNNFQMTVTRPADVTAYYRADLEAQVAGEVTWVRVAVGSVVEKGRVLVKIAVPDKAAVVKERQNIVGQRQTELAVMQEKLKAATVAVKTAQANVDLKKTLLLQAQADTRLRDAQFSRIDQLWRNNAQDKNVRDEALRGVELARAAETAADAATRKAEAEVADANANVDVMRADVNRSKQLIEVAKAEVDQAAAISGFAEVKAPFAGAVVSRHIDPGSFVQNASTGHPTSLLTLQRSDIVTVVMRVPDNYASFIGPGTEAVIQLDDLPGLSIHGKVTRFAPSLVTAANDRTMRVEVDLWNEPPEAYQPFLADARNRAELKDGPPPILPDYRGRAPAPAPAWQPLLPGRYGKMTLVLKAYGPIKLIPSQAIVRHGGRTSIYVVQEGKAHLIPVEAQVDDGTAAHVILMGPDHGLLGELADGEQVIVSNQDELSEGQAVTAVPAEGAESAKAVHSAP